MIACSGHQWIESQRWMWVGSCAVDGLLEHVFSDELNDHDEQSIATSARSNWQNSDHYPDQFNIIQWPTNSVHILYLIHGI